MASRFYVKSLVLAICLAWAFNTNAFGAEKMVLVYFEDYQPFSWKDENGRMKGLLVDLLIEALQKRMKISVEHRGYPWARAQEMVRFGEADGFCTVPTTERKQYTWISNEPVVNNTVTIFTWKNNPQIGTLKKAKTVEDLKDFRHGQYSGSGWARKNLKGMNVLWVSSLSQVLEMLAAQRIEIVAESSFVMRHRIKSMQLEDRVLEIPNVVDSNAFNLCIGKKSPYKDILKNFDRVMVKIRRDGTHKNILDKYR